MNSPVKVDQRVRSAVAKNEKSLAIFFSAHMIRLI
jgi:hypothetical protein